jgi:cytochrome c oxidase assembly protein subunit 11
MATYNVSPDVAGQYFNKVFCFCFEQQRLDAGEDMEMPVQFFIDPDFAKDPLLKNINEITLSYTFFVFKKK